MTGAATQLILSRPILLAARDYPEKAAIVFGDAVLSYATLAAQIRAVAATLTADLGLRRGDRIVVACSNRPEFFAIVLGAAHAGLICVTLNPLLTTAEYGAIFKDAEPKLVFADSGNAAPYQVAAAAGCNAMVIDDLDKWLRSANADAEYDVSETDPFVISYTSGTTGVPKGVVLSHRSRALTAMAMHHEYGCFGRDDHFLQMTPLFHGAGFAYPYAAMAGGGTVHLLPGFDAAAIWQAFAGKITGAFVVPTILGRLLAAWQDCGSPALSLHLRTIICNAAALSPEIKRAFIDRFGEAHLHETYGSTEAGVVTNMRPHEMVENLASVGRPFPHIEIQLRDDNGLAVEDGEQGELFARGPYTFNGYWNNSTDTLAAIDQHGWITAGDLAVRDHAGHYTIVGRKKDMILSGGVNIYPREIEMVLERHAAIDEALVVGVSDSEWGERVHALYVLRDGATITERELEAHCREQLAAYKRPRGYSQISEVPRNASGKPLRAVAAELVQ
jgi:acyl-CoA synthetase (AMP-forming)/AMP-acid ligase II